MPRRRTRKLLRAIALAKERFSSGKTKAELLARAKYMSDQHRLINEQLRGRP